MVLVGMPPILKAVVQVMQLNQRVLPLSQLVKPVLRLPLVPPAVPVTSSG